MFTEILKIVPKLDRAELARMELTLSQRFTRVAKKFGKGLVSAVKGGGVLGIALGLVDKLLNPLKEIQEAIDKTLQSADSLVTNAKAFGTTAGKLFKLQQLGLTQGLDSDNLFLLIHKFQTAVAEAKNDPTQPSAVREFTDIPDTADAFFQFIQSLQKMDKNQQLLVQQSVFGEKQILKMAEFLQSDFGPLSAQLKGADTEKLTKQLTKLEGLEGKQRILEANRNIGDVGNKSRLLNEGILKEQDKQERLNLERENQNISNFKNLAVISQASTKMATLVEQGLAEIVKIVDKLANINNVVSKIPGARFFRGIFGGGD
jgi:hypothetical protein